MTSLYSQAGTVLQKSEQHKGSLKSLVFSGSETKESLKRSKALFAVACQTLKYKPVIDTVVCNANLMKEVKGLAKDKWLLRVCVYELLFGKGLRGKYKLILDKHKVRLKSELARYKIKHKIVNDEHLVTDSLHPTILRFVRINTLKIEIQKAIESLSTQYHYVDIKGANFETFLKRIKNLDVTEFARDLHVPELLVFSPGAKVTEHQLYKTGAVILQDKASCFPGHIASTLDIPHDCHVIDCCAAPGNKTSHVAAIKSNRGKIFAFDRDSKRINDMKKLLKKSEATSVQVAHCDFLQVSPTDEKYKDVTLAIVDPSCSGSGIVSRMNHLTDTDQQSSDITQRLQKLSTFQEKILLHALAFPAIQYVIYSTCSVHTQENEEVVRNVLHKCNDNFDLHHILPEYPSRGMHGFKNIGRHCIRLNPQTDCTNGFFVACFKRKDLKTANEEFVIDCNGVNENQETSFESDSCKRKLPTLNSQLVSKTQHSKKKRKMKTIHQDNKETGINGTDLKFLESEKLQCEDEVVQKGRTKDLVSGANGRNKKKQRRRKNPRKPVTQK